jgi:hypothetical protein
MIKKRKKGDNSVKKMFNLLMPQNLICRLNRYSKEVGINKSAIIIMALNEYLERNQKNESKIE